MFQISFLDELLISAKDIATETRKNPVLLKVLDLTLSGWPSYVTDESLKPFLLRRDQLSTDHGCILWGSSVIIPPKYRERLLSELHEGHRGVVRMKMLARGYLWWPGLNNGIQNFVSNCIPCELERKKTPCAPLHLWSWTTTPWECIHIDYAEIDQQHFLVSVDGYSKWVEIFPTQLTNAGKTINILCKLLSAYGLPKELVSDNGPPFTSREFEEFVKNNGVRHILSPPYHPAINGQAERVVHTFKKAWERLCSVLVSPPITLGSYFLNLSKYSSHSNGTNTCRTVLKKAASNPSRTAKTKYLSCCSQTSNGSKRRLMTHRFRNSDLSQRDRRSLCAASGIHIVLGFLV